jgi:hypothetical protein
LNEQIPVQLYIQRGIKREGLRDKVMLNPTTFDVNEEVVAHFRSVVKERFGGVPAVSTSELQETSPLNEKQRSVSMQRPAINPEFDFRIEFEPLRYRRTLARIDAKLQTEIETAVSETERSRSDSVLHEHLAATAGPHRVWLHGSSPPSEMGQRPPLPYQEIAVYAGGVFIIRFAQEDSDMLAQAFRLMANAYHLMRRIYPKFELPLQGRAKLDFNLHAGRNKFSPVINGGTWSSDVDASKPFDEAYSDLTLLMTRGAGLNLSSEEIQERLRAYRDGNMPALEH